MADVGIAAQVEVASVALRIRDTGGSWTCRAGAIGRLAIVQRLTVLPGGTLAVGSAPGVGSVFPLTLTRHGGTTP